MAGRWISRGRAAAALLLAASCTTPATRSTPAPSIAQPSATAAASVPEEPPNLLVVSLPVLPHTQPIPQDAYPVFLTKQEVYLGAPARLALRLPSAIPSPLPDGVFQPVGAALAQRECGPGGSVPPVAVIHADAEVAYLWMFLLATALQDAGYARVFVAGRSSDHPLPRGALSQFGIPVARFGGRPVVISVEPDGYRVLLDVGVHLMCGARELAPVTLPRDEMLACVGDLGDRAVTGGSATSSREVLEFASAMSEGVVVALVHPSAPPAAEGQEGGTVANAARVVAALRNLFRVCYERELKRNPKAGGKVDVAISVGQSGEVTRVELDPSGSLGQVPWCMKTMVGSAHFEPPAGGSAVIHVPVVFDNRRSGQPKPACRRRQ